MDKMLTLKLQDEHRLHSDAVRWFNNRRVEIQFEVPLEELSDDDLDAFLLDDEKHKFQSCINEISKGLSRCINTDGASPDPVTNAIIGLTVLEFQVNSLLPMHNIKLLLKKAYNRKREEQKRIEEEEKH